MDIVLALLLAPIIGSFVACAAIRLPAGEGLWGRSSCPRCGHRLGAAELVPLLSWLLQRGHCRTCGGAISAFYPIIEAMALAIAVSAILVLDGWRLAAGLGLGWSLLLLAAIDWRCQLLPDGLTLPLAAAGLCLAMLFEPAQLPARAVAAAAGWAVFAALGAGYRQLRGQDGLGGGDGKLVAAAGAWIGPLGLPWVVLMAALGGLAAIAVAALAGGGWPADKRLPFGPFLAAAIWLVWLAVQATG
jgi:leader peptidase (prepilin peptidase)/N-methyltransferase